MCAGTPRIAASPRPPGPVADQTHHHLTPPCTEIRQERRIAANEQSCPTPTLSKSRIAPPGSSPAMDAVSASFPPNVHSTAWRAARSPRFEMQSARRRRLRRGTPLARVPAFADLEGIRPWLGSKRWMLPVDVANSACRLGRVADILLHPRTIAHVQRFSFNLVAPVFGAKRIPKTAAARSRSRPSLIGRTTSDR